MAHNNGTRRPSTSAMVDCLEEMLTPPEQGPVYIILDALDECPDSSGIGSVRMQVLTFLRHLVGFRLPNLHICVTSRPEMDIRAVLEPLASSSVQIQDQKGQKRDIEEYVRSVVANSDTAMRSWRDQDKELVIDTLSEKVDGM